MRRPFRMSALAGLAAAAGLLGMGCDYMGNLVGDKRVTKSDLTLTIKDAWTGEAVPYAACSGVEGEGRSGGGDVAFQWTAAADAEGRIIRTTLSTGKHFLVCGSVGYHESESTLEIRSGAGGAAEVRLARLGGADWYPDHPERQVSLRLIEGDRNFRFPGTFRVTATPMDSTGTFEYEWTSSIQRPLPGTTIKPGLSITTHSLPTDFTVETISVNIVAKLAGRRVVVGTGQLDISLSRNLPPTLRILRPPPDSVRFCKENSTFRIALESRDSDGQCLSMTFRSTDPSSSLGLIQQTTRCSPESIFVFSLARHASQDSIPLTRPNALQISVRDDNGEEVDTVIRFKTIANLPPRATLTSMQAASETRANAPLMFNLVLEDTDDAVAETRIDWKDGGESMFIPDAVAKNRVEMRYEHTYTQPGIYDIQISTKDICGDSTAVTHRVNVIAPP